ncbi:polyprenol phosphomannose-dependent alpha 1,6 mannosyltransferase MptB [Pseudonocardia yunnanensis]|uniref:Polyprenol phosphomannose-dependent alpha 1,6 mannosyltransferase MptB n=1 Tax=Pseudonocardia yunnanensis TaxID=58107 RepID=A0ABW4F064_9PSEU
MKPPSSVDGSTLPEALPDAAPAERASASVAAPAEGGAAPGGGTAEREPLAPASAPASGSAWRARLGNPPRRPLLLGLAGSVMMVIGGYGAGGVLVRDPLLTNSPLGFWRYGHGRELATVLVYIGVALMLWAWVQLGRDVLARRVGGRAVLTIAMAWTVPVLFAPPLFTRDIFSYLAQGGLSLAGFDPYAVGPDAMPGIWTDNVHYFWQDTPAPYGPLFILIAKAVAWATGDNIIFGVVLMRLALLPGLLLLVWALPELTRRLGGRVPLALWIAVANPVMVIHMIGGGHNDLLVVGLLAAGSLVALRGKPAGGIALVTGAMAVKASAGVALPFLVLVWAARLPGTRSARIVKATAAGVGVFVVVFAACTFAAGVSLGWLPALSAPSMIVNWMSFPTGAGEFLHALIGLAAPTVPKQPFINVGRVIGAIVLVWIAVRQWLAARDGGPDAIHRAGIVLLAVAVLSPATLPWYVSWGMALLAMVAWSPRGLAWVVFCSLMLVIVYYPNGEDALYNWPYLAGCALVAALAAVSLLRPDPLRLAAGARSRRKSPEAVPVTVPAVPAAAVPAAGAERPTG